MQPRSTLPATVKVALEKACAMHDGLEGLAKAITACGYGKLTKGAVHQWFTIGVPAHRAKQIEQATQGLVHRSDLRPDLYS